ncbi:MAG: Zn-ribbon domain-containing OB-fold protein [Nitrososphaerota archaeon]|nr:Zn-ribbon domain-containing OB-fold protein [Nitrososphaerota archaeon]MDG7024241.1 Zn-ribbon domain-containing OB-fold protein [Nitrososphaerota archaeon]
MPESPVLHSRRTLTLRFDIPISKTHEFWDALKSGKFITTKCTKCGHVSFPPQADCPRCMGNEFSWVELGRDATLVTYTRVQVVPASFAGSNPYVIAIGELKDGLKVLAWLEGAEPEKAKPGMRLWLEARTSKEGNPYYVFVPI